VTITAETDTELERVALYWRAIELLSPQRLPRVAARAHVDDFFPGEPMPWEAGSRVAAVSLAPGQVWRHEVYGGVFDVQRVADVLVREFGDDGPVSQRDPVPGQSALFACTVDADGLLVDQSAVLSSCAWAAGRVCGHREMPGDRLAGFGQDVLRFGERLGKLCGRDFGGGVQLLAPGMRTDPPTPADTPAPPLSPRLYAPVRLENRRLTGPDLKRFAAELAGLLGVGWALEPGHIRVRSYQLPEARAGEPPEPACLNSFLVGDLERVARAVREGDAGPGLVDYLSNRGSQRFAVNQVMEHLGDGSGLLAISGPPATGTATMLRDLIAAVVVQRAQRLARLRRPHDAFTGTASHRWSTDRGRHTVVAPQAELTGSEIVVASASNSAVENVTAEISGTGGIGAQWQVAAAELGYFTATAQRACGDGAWAMVAARLGNREDCRDFVQRFWWGNGRQDRRDGMQCVLKALEDEPVDWAAEVARFSHAVDAVRSLAAPWADEELTAARTELFLAALRLHQAFLTAEAATVRRNLSALMDVLKGQAPRPPAAAVRAAWQTFFLLVPVVSSAFASVGRLFAGFGRESLGWLLIDQAGQAAPQQAAGAIWRARRTVVVGGPLPAGPAVTMSWGGQQALARLYAIPEEWAPGRTSVQDLADRGNRREWARLPYYGILAGALPVD
jgi:hypothetical protein